MNGEQHPAGKPVDEEFVDAKQDEAKAAEPEPRDPRRRLRELLAIPERDRSDALWDEIVSLEIQLAPGNRATSAPGEGGRNQEPGRRHEAGRRQEPGRRPEQGRRQGAASEAKSGKRFAKRSRRGPGSTSKT